MKFDVGHVTVRKRNRLPHWDAEHGIYFVTFNPFDALSAEVRARIRAEADAQIAAIRQTREELSLAERHRIEQRMRQRINQSLDDIHGQCFMRDRRIAEIVADAITCFDEQRYWLLTWCVMPNHVH